MRSRKSSAWALAVVAAASAVTAMAEAPPTGGAPRVIEVSAGQSRFEPALINVAAGERVVLKARSTDGKKHGLSIKALGVKVALPKTGEVVPIEFTAGEPGTYTIACSVYCGRGHSRMRAQLVVAARP